MSTQKFWVAWQTVVSFVIPALTIIACWAILIYLFLTRQFHRYASWFVLNEVGANMNWSISYSQDCPNAFEKSLKNRYIHIITGFCSILKSVTLKAMFVTGFFLLCASPFCISFFVVISIIILMMMTILVMMMVLVIIILHHLFLFSFWWWWQFWWWWWCWRSHFSVSFFCCNFICCVALENSFLKYVFNVVSRFHNIHSL